MQADLTDRGSVSALALLCLLAGCSKTAEPVDSGPPPVVEPPSETGETADTGPVAWVPTQQACATVPPLPSEYQSSEGWGYMKDFAFDDQGYLVGTTQTYLLAYDSDGFGVVRALDFGGIWGLGYASDGDLVVLRNPLDEVGRVTPDDQRSVWASGIERPVGVANHLDGTAWITSRVGVWHVLASGDATLVLPDIDSTGIALSPDFRRVFVTGYDHHIRVLPLDSAGFPSGEAESIAQLVEAEGWPNSLTTDVCGNVYVAQRGGLVRRFLPDGTPAGELRLDTGGPLVAIRFGSGLGGFTHTSLYAHVTEAGGTLFEVDVGIEGKWEPHYPIPSP
ncbi:MAG: hypothetical protein H6737_16430 [Alphaproteobacteria bacterium]|nr:hypothetical protein [Alphaproteobacteria bacterium]